MKKIICFSLFILATFFSYSFQIPSENISKENKASDSKVIPTPKKFLLGEGRFTIDETTTIGVKNSELLPIAELLIDYIQRYSGIKLTIAKSEKQKNHILIELNDQIAADSYSLSIENMVHIKGHDYKAVAQAAATLVQLMEESDGKFKLPNSEITDAPVHEYRAVLVDVARFWQPLETIYETIDLMWFYKMEYLQLHLTDHQRFTFPLEKYPKLKTVNENGQREYYTKEELMGMVEYARQRGVTIVPEIELPGHSTALWNTYPDTFGNVDPETGEPDQLFVVNIAKEEAYLAIKDILNEVASIFNTSPYIHIGADEVSLKNIVNVPGYQEYVRKQGLTEAANGDPQELFCHFINRLNKMVKDLGKKTLAWEGFPDSGAGSVTVDKDITVMAWNTTYNPPQNLIDHGYTIINATWLPWYLVGAMNFAPENNTSYSWNIGKWEHWQPDYPKIQLKDTSAVIGGQLTFWEQTHEQVLPLLRKKMPLITEKLWSPQFTSVMQDEKALERMDRKYQKIFSPLHIDATNLLKRKDQTFTDSVTIDLSSSQQGDIRYQISKSWDFADLKDAKKYVKPFHLKESGVVTAQNYDANNNPVGYKIQEYYTKIKPAYTYKVYGHPPTKGWQVLPSSDTLQLIREGYTGKMNDERLTEINRRLFAKVASGHIDTRLYNQFNAYLLELSGAVEISDPGEYSIELRTYDGLAEIFIDGKRIVKGKNFEDAPEYFATILSEGRHELIIKYYLKNIRNRLSIKYKKENMQKYEPFENLVRNIE